VILAVLAVVATAVVIVLLNGLLRSTSELVRLLRTERPTETAANVPDAGARASRIVPDASSDAAPRRPVEVTNEVPPPEDAGLEDAAVGDATSEDAEIAPPDAEEPVEAAPLVEQPPQRVQCGWRMCPEGEVCCNWSCSTCAPPGQICDYLCGAPSIAISIPCGPNTCNVTEVCCNHTCGICVPSGETCSQEPCLFDPIYDPYSAPCGLNTCNVGEVCCNPSCGICTKPGERCSIEPCSR
jgi:hypothetical protein